MADVPSFTTPEQVVDLVNRGLALIPDTGSAKAETFSGASVLSGIKDPGWWWATATQMGFPADPAGHMALVHSEALEGGGMLFTAFYDGDLYICDNTATGIGAVPLSPGWTKVSPGTASTTSTGVVKANGTTVKVDSGGTLSVGVDELAADSTFVSKLAANTSFIDAISKNETLVNAIVSKVPKVPLVSVENDGIVPALPKNPYVDGYLPPFIYSITVDNEGQSPTNIYHGDDCAEFTLANGSDLGDFSSFVKKFFKPCVIAAEDTKPKYYLQYDNYTLKENGSPAVLGGTDGDVMVECVPLWIKLEDMTGKADDTGHFETSAKRFKASFSDQSHGDGWFTYSSSDGGNTESALYIGVYKGTKIDNKLRSVIPEDRKPLTWQSVTSLCNSMQTGVGTYSLETWRTRALFCLVFMLLYGTKDSRKALGIGHTNSGAFLGDTNEKPFCYGTQDNSDSIKFLGVENYWGDVNEVLDPSITYASQTLAITWAPKKAYSSSFSDMDQLSLASDPLPTSTAQEIKTVLADSTTGNSYDRTLFPIDTTGATAANLHRNYCDGVRAYNSTTPYCVQIGTRGIFDVMYRNYGSGPEKGGSRIERLG